MARYGTMVAVKVGFARDVAIRWVRRYAPREAGYAGAFFSGSTTLLSDDAELAATSDVDVVIVLDRSAAPEKLGKFVYHGVLLEVSYLTWHELASPEAVLSSYHLAGSFDEDTIITDPTGRLHHLHEHVSRGFATRRWVRQRCEDARASLEAALRDIDEWAPFAHQVTSWLFGTGKTTHVLLVAALRNPTVRLRYVAARDVLAEYDRSDFYPELLDLLGCVHLSRARVQHHLRGLAQTFDAAVAVARSPFFFSSDITPVARPIAIDGSQELIDSNLHREAMFWIIATYARCHTILAADAPRAARHEFLPAFEAALGDLGITSADDLRYRAEAVLRFIPSLWDVTEDILTSNPDIRTR
jgi:hypothetical protein